MRLLVLIAALAACSESEPAAQPQPAPPAAQHARDAGITAITGFDPASGMHLDDDTAHRPPETAPGRAGRPIDVTLRSTPSGAEVAVDGIAIGSTPTFWAGQADGHEHEFTFNLRRHALARYRFVPVTSGVVHARLEPIIEEPDAGVPPIEVVPVPPSADGSSVNSAPSAAKPGGSSGLGPEP